MAEKTRKRSWFRFQFSLKATLILMVLVAFCIVFAQRPVQVDSGAIKSVHYDRWQQTLDIEFVYGARYRYFDVKRGTYLQFLKSDWKGRYFSKHIRGGYEFENLSQESRKLNSSNK